MVQSQWSKSLMGTLDNSCPQWLPFWLRSTMSIVKMTAKKAAGFTYVLCYILAVKC